MTDDSKHPNKHENDQILFNGHEKRRKIQQTEKPQLLSKNMEIKNIWNEIK